MRLFKRTYSASELQAMSQAYKQNEQSGSKVVVPLIYTGLYGLFSYILTAQWIITGIIVFIALWYSYLILVPSEVSSSYYRRGYSQRWKAINTMTQALSNRNNKAIDVIGTAAKRANGEFKDDLVQVISILSVNESPQVTHKAFDDLKIKYEDDDLFSQFIEQLETFHTDGVADRQTFNRINSSYNATYEEQDDFVKIKSHMRSNAAIFLVVIFALIFMVSNQLGFKNWVTVYAHSFIGMVVTFTFLISSFFYMNSWFKQYYNDNLTRNKQ